MFDYANKMKLAVQDSLRRTVLKAVAGLFFLIALGFLTATLWTYLATGLGWGSMYASATIAGGFAVIALILLVIGGRVLHEAPSTDELRTEVEARLALATDAAANRTRAEVFEVVDGATQRANDLIDRAGSTASHVVSQTGGAIRGTARMAGLTSENIEAARDTAEDYAQKAKAAADTNAGSMAKLIGAFAVGMTIAATLKGGRRDEDDDRYADFDDDGYYRDYDRNDRRYR